MKLVRLIGGKPAPEAKFEVTVHGYSMMIKCPCGTVWTTTVPGPGRQREEMCPSGCGHGIDVDARPIMEVQWVDLPPPGPLEDVLRNLTYPVPEVLRNAFRIPEERFHREYLCEPVPAGFDWFCGVCRLGYYSPDVKRSDADSNPLCRCGRVLNGSHEQPPGLRWVGEDDGD